MAAKKIELELILRNGRIATLGGEPFIKRTGHSWEKSAFYLTAGTCLALGGAAPWSLDAWLFGLKGNSTGRVTRGLPPGKERKPAHDVRRLT